MIRLLVGRLVGAKSGRRRVRSVSSDKPARGFISPKPMLLVLNDGNGNARGHVGTVLMTSGMEKETPDGIFQKPPSCANSNQKV